MLETVNTNYNLVGKTIRIIYYLLSIDNKVNEHFTARDICSQYNIHKNCQTLNNLLKCKNGAIKKILMLKDESKLYWWLHKHTYHKKIYWFNKFKDDTFTIKKEHLRPLSKLL